MNHHSEMAGMDVIVGLVLLFCVVLVAAWFFSPRLRAWIEKPNYEFQRGAQAFDQALQTSTMAKGGKTR